MQKLSNSDFEEQINVAHIFEISTSVISKIAEMVFCDSALVKPSFNCLSYQLDKQLSIQVWKELECIDKIISKIVGLRRDSKREFCNYVRGKNKSMNQQLFDGRINRSKSMWCG